MKLKDWIYPETTEIDTERDLSIIENYLPPKGKILDAGAGMGRIVIPLAKKGYRITLLDISKTTLNFAKKLAKKAKVLKFLEFVEGNVCNLKFKTNSFDLVLALRDVVNYALDKRRAAKELIRVLKPNWYLIASASNKVFWSVEPERWSYEVEKIEQLMGAKSMLTEAELKKLFRGLKIEEVLGSGYIANLSKNKLNKKWVEIEQKVGNDKELKFACEYLVLIGRKNLR